MPAADFPGSQNAWATPNSKRSPANGTPQTGRPYTTWLRVTRPPALKSYSARGRLILGEDERTRWSGWSPTGKRQDGVEEKLILSSTNHQAATLNGLCQEERQRRGELGRDSVTVRDGAEVHAGDRVLFRRNDKRVGVHNGDLATVIKVTTADESAQAQGVGHGEAR